MERVIAQDQIAQPGGMPMIVVTVEIGPGLWETRITNGRLDGTVTRAASRAAALEHHGASVRRVYQALERGEQDAEVVVISNRADADRDPLADQIKQLGVHALTCSTGGRRLSVLQGTEGDVRLIPLRVQVVAHGAGRLARKRLQILRRLRLRDPKLPHQVITVDVAKDSQGFGDPV